MTSSHPVILFWPLLQKAGGSWLSDGKEAWAEVLSNMCFLDLLRYENILAEESGQKYLQSLFCCPLVSVLGWLNDSLLLVQALYTLMNAHLRFKDPSTADGQLEDIYNHPLLSAFKNDIPFWHKYVPFTSHAINSKQAVDTCSPCCACIMLLGKNPVPNYSAMYCKNDRQLLLKPEIKSK